MGRSQTSCCLTSLSSLPLPPFLFPLVYLFLTCFYSWIHRKQPLREAGVDRALPNGRRIKDTSCLFSFVIKHKLLSQVNYKYSNCKEDSVKGGDSNDFKTSFLCPTVWTFSCSTCSCVAKWYCKGGQRNDQERRKRKRESGLLSIRIRQLTQDESAGRNHVRRLDVELEVRSTIDRKLRTMKSDIKPRRAELRREDRGCED
ncbi:hypothetical protein MUK42_16536 [Musa troglodytarum]|uniref:Uncharacterized protein n=1 Tax=Musa troglodytarum TaxID=320322 RepID=A0A9E7KXR5_9LILI|nr:hypothetical protein MUK42_16536 [Musa troglodytarum]